MIDEIGIEEVYDHENLDEVKEMRPGLPRDFYAGLALRDNYTREMAGLDHWQADFPIEGFHRPDANVSKLSLEELLDLIL